MSDVQTPPSEDFLRAFKELQRKVEDISNSSVAGNQLVTGDLVGGFGASRVGCLLCDGSTIADSDYPALGAHIRANLPVAYVVDGTHVKLPDYRGAALGGSDGATFVKGTEVGVETITLTAAQSGQPAIAGGTTGSTTPGSTGSTTPADTGAGSAHHHGGSGGNFALTTFTAQVASGASFAAVNSVTGATTDEASHTHPSAAHTHTSAAHTHTTPAVAAANAASSHGNVQPTLPANIFIKI